MTRPPVFIAAIATALGVAASLPAQAQEKLSAEQLAKLAQNPIANLISVPFQNDTNFNYGPRDGTQNVLNIQPVIPISLGKDWNLITRTILPVITQPAFNANESATTGLGRPAAERVPLAGERGGRDLGRRRDHAGADARQRPPG